MAGARAVLGALHHTRRHREGSEQGWAATLDLHGAVDLARLVDGEIELHDRAGTRQDREVLFRRLPKGILERLRVDADRRLLIRIEAGDERGTGLIGLIAEDVVFAAQADIRQGDVLGTELAVAVTVDENAGRDRAGAGKALAAEDRLGGGRPDAE